MARQGLTDEEMATELGVSRATFAKWKDKYPLFLDALQAKKEANEIIADSVFKRAHGYEYQEIVREPPTKAEEKEFTDAGLEIPKLIVRKVVTKHMPGDATSAIFYLKNRDAKNWRDKQDVEHSFSEPIVIKIED
jgi:hypothetical protein